jgi:hypothetical protein
MTIICKMRAQPARGLIPGTCPAPACGKPVFESLARLDDAYNVWVGQCPHCGAHAMLSMRSLRGYSSDGMQLVLPTVEEVRANSLPTDTPHRGSGGPAVLHGTQAGEVQHKLREQGK